MPSQQQAHIYVNGTRRPADVNSGHAAAGGPGASGGTATSNAGPRPGTSGLAKADRGGREPLRPIRVVRSSADVKKRGAWVYVKHALMHPWHVVVLAGATVFGVANWSFLVLLLVFGGAELLLLGLVLRLRPLRRHVDDRLEQIDRARAAEQRATLLLQMGDEHRRELVRLESVVDRIRDVAGPHGTAAQVAVGECLRLLASYVRLAIAHNVSHECLATVDRGSLDDDARALEAARASRGAHVRELAGRRLAIAQKRAARWDRSREGLDAITHQLAMIGELVHLTHEQVAAPADPRAATGELDRALGELDDHHSTLEELAEFLGVEETIDPRVLDHGRAAEQG